LPTRRRHRIARGRGEGVVSGERQAEGERVADAILEAG
jgi:hypothetical protein